MQNSPQTISLTEHDKFALLWDLADEIAKEGGATPEKCWLKIMDAFWIGQLPTLFCFTRRKGGNEGRVLMQLPPRDIIAEHLCGPRNAADYADLRGWTLQDYQKHEPFRFYVERDSRFGLAIRSEDFKRWRENMVSHRLSISSPKSLAGGGVTTAKNKRRKHRGPVPGTVDRYGNSDRELFPEMDRLVRNNMSPLEAARKLVGENRVSGRGGNYSRARRLAGRYRRESNN